MNQSEKASALTDEQLIEAVATRVMGWTRTIHMPKSTWVDPLDDEHGDWNPLTDWNHTMEVWKQMVDMKFTPGIDQTDDHATVVVGRLDGLGCLEMFVHIEHEVPQRTILLAALSAVSYPPSP